MNVRAFFYFPVGTRGIASLPFERITPILFQGIVSPFFQIIMSQPYLSKRPYRSRSINQNI